MVGTKTLICGVWLCGVWISTQPAHADGEPARWTLKMRTPAAAPVHGSPPRGAKRVGQVPAPEPPGADADPAPAPPDVGSSDAGGVPPGLVAPTAPAPAPRAVPSIFAVTPEDASEDEPDARPVRHRRSRALFTVTGSLIERATLTTPSPVTILRRDDLLAAGRSMIGDILQPMPEQGNALNAQFNNGGDGSTRIDLRSLGIDRTLTLLNGRRFVPVGTGADTAVDLNAIPLAVIERVEVLKDAGSAVYGSDAIAGVVNIITRTQFQGTEASLYTAETERKDGFTFDASFITGHRTQSGRGNIIFSAGTQRQEPVLAGDRDFSKVVKAFDFQSGVATPTGSSATPSGRIDARAIDLNGDGRPDPINLCGANVPFCTNDGLGGFRPFIAPRDLYNFAPVNDLYTPSSRVNAYTAGSYRLGDGVEGFFEASFLHRASEQQLASTPLTTGLFGIVISRDSVFNPIGGDVLSYNRRLDEFGPRRFSQSIDTMRTVMGMRGSTSDDPAAPDAWKWELSFNYGGSDSTQKAEGGVVLSRVRNAVGPSFISPNGVPTCGTPFAPIAGCVPMNLLGPAGSISADARDYAAFTGIDTGSDVEQMALATAHGRIARLPGGGDVALAVTADVRQETGEFNPDPLVATGDTTGNPIPAVSGSTRVAEAAAELSIVPIRDRDGVERLEVDLAARAFRYDSFGDGVTSSIRALLRPVRGITLRTSYSTAFRAPSVTELFQARVDDFPFGTDPCDHAFGAARSGTLSPTSDECAREGVPPNAIFGTSQQHAITHGNPKLQPETAKVANAGIVLESPRAPGLSLSVDYWNIEVTQGIQSPLLQTVFTSCYERNIRSFCDLVHRDPAQGFAIDFVDLPFLNVGGTSTSGVDVGVGFDHHTPGVGDLHARLDVQELRSFDVDTGLTVLHGLGNYDLGVHPKRKASLLAVWRQSQGMSAGFNFHFVDSFIECQNDNCNDPTNPSRQVDSYSKLDVFSSVTLGRHPGATTLTVGVNNVFDRAPPVIFNGPAGNFDEATYDFLGRFAYARLTQSF